MPDDIISGNNFFFKLLDAINTPQQITFGALRGALSGEDIAQSAIQGARENISFSDLLGDLGVEEGLGRSAAGLVGDVVLDPTNLLAIGPVAQGVRKGAGALSRASRLDKLGAKAAAGTPGELIRRTVSPTFGLTGNELHVAQAAQNARKILRLQGNKKIDAAFRLKQEGFDAAKEMEILERGGTTLLDGGLVDIEKADPIEVLAKRYDLTKSQAFAVIDEIAERGLGVSPGRAVQGDVLLADKIFGEGGFLARRTKKNLRDTLGLSPRKATQSELAPLVSGANAADSALPLTALDETVLTVGAVRPSVRKTAAEQVSSTQSILKGVPKEVFQDEGFRRWALLLKKTRENENAITFAKGIKTIELNDESLDYLLHLPLPAVRKALAKAETFKVLGREWSASHASQLARTLRGMSIKDINDLGRQGKLPVPGLEGIRFEKVLEDDPIYLELVRQLRDAKARATSDLFQDLAIQGMKSQKLVSGAKGMKPTTGRIGGFATKVENLKEMPAGWRIIDVMPGAPDDLRAMSPLAQAFDQIAWHPDVAKHLQAYVEFTNDTFQGGSMLNSFLQHFDDVQDAWKTLTLGVRPAYHARNVVGNLFNNYLGGVVNPMVYAKAARVAKGTEDVSKSVSVQVGDRTLTGNEILTAAEDLGIVRTGQYLGDVVPHFEKKGFGITQALRGEGRNIPGVTKVVKTGQQVGGVLEDNARLAHFIDRLEKGDNLTQAAASVKKHLFDYADLTDVERKIFRRVIPFYSWMKNNGVLQVDTLINKPYKYQPIGDLVNTVQNSTEAPLMEEQILPEFIKEMSGVRWRRDDQGNPEYFLLGSWLPAADIHDIAKPFLGRDGVDRLDPIISRLTPFIQKPIEMVTNQSLFFRSEIERFEGEKQKFLGVQLRKRTVNLIKSLVLVNEADRIINGGIIPGFSDRSPQTLPENAAQTILGLKLYNVDERKALAHYFYKRERDTGQLKAALKRARRTGDLPDQETLREILRKRRDEERRAFQ